MDRLPIDAILPEIVRLAAGHRRVVVEAPPGAGKTTRVPWALMAATGPGEILVSEPRRLAARLAARRVAQERSMRLGDEVGYTVRFEDVASSRTRVRYVTDGVLLRRMASDPALTGVAAIVLDEIHERHLATDVTLALLGRCQTTTRPDLIVIAMSATLQAATIARFFGDCPRVASEGRVHELTVRHLPEPDDRPLPTQVLSAVRTVLREGPLGDVLIFVPGAAEIRAATDLIVPVVASDGIDVLPLHGDLTVEDQARAVGPSARRKIVLSTNVAESSVTIDGVTTVIDSGITRLALHSPWSGVPSLATRPASRASAAQRAGRAGRTAPGLVLRLYTRGDHDRRPAQDAPEIARADLSEAMLLLHGAGVARPGELAWLDEPPPAAIHAAEQLLVAIGAVDAAGRLSRVGLRMLDLPVHPRLARMLVECEDRGVTEEGARAAAILSERDPRLDTRTHVGVGRHGPRIDGRDDCDVTAISDQLDSISGGHARHLAREGLDPRAVATIERTERALGRGLRSDRPRPSQPAQAEAELRYALLTGYPDRVARRRRPGDPALVLVGGDPARLGPSSVVHDAPYLLALDAVEQTGPGQRGIVVRLASAIDPAWLIDLPGDALKESEEFVWNVDNERVDRVTRLAYGSVSLDEARGRAHASPAAAAVLARAARARAWEADALESVMARLDLIATHAPTALTGVPVTPTADTLLTAACHDATSFAELRERSLVDRLLASLPPPTRSALERLAPLELTLSAGRRLRLTYCSGRSPFVAARIQDLFGITSTPTICQGTVPIVVHLLAPNRRAVQVTTDLAGFWERHYPAVRRELMRRYPKHSWPEDGAHATPPPRRPGRP